MAATLLAGSAPGRLQTLPREIQTHIATHVRGRLPGDDGYSHVDLGALRLCNKQWADIGEPLLYELHMRQPMLYEDFVSGPQEQRYWAKYTDNLRAGAFTASLPTGMLTGTGNGARETVEMMTTDSDMGTAALVRKCTKLRQVYVSCKTVANEEQGSARLLRYTFHAICASLLITEVDLAAVDSAVSVNLAAELVDAMVNLENFGLSMTPQPADAAEGDFEILSSMFRFSRALFRAKKLQHLRLSGPCLSDVTEHKSFTPKLRSMDATSQHADKALRAIVLRCWDSLEMLSLDRTSICGLQHEDHDSHLSLPCLRSLFLSVSGDAEEEDLAAGVRAPGLQDLSIAGVKGSAGLANRLLQRNVFPRIKRLRIVQHQRDAASAAIATYCADSEITLTEVYFDEGDGVPEHLQQVMKLLADDAEPEAIAAALEAAGLPIPAEFLAEEDDSSSSSEEDEL